MIRRPIGKHSVLSTSTAFDPGPFGVGSRLNEAACKVLDPEHKTEGLNRSERRFLAKRGRRVA